jgi:undecaprenyl-diphosphatase
MDIDYFLFQKINNLAGHYWLLDRIAMFFADFFIYILVILLLLFLLVGFNEAEKKKNRLMVLYAFLSAIIARYFFTEIIRWFYSRPRPFMEHQVIQLLGHDYTGSLPSGHAAFAFALATVVYCYNKKFGWLFFIGAFLIGLARIFVGLHYPLDILAGAAVGIFSGWLVYRSFVK